MGHVSFLILALVLVLSNPRQHENEYE